MICKLTSKIIVGTSITLIFCFGCLFSKKNRQIIPEHEQRQFQKNLNLSPSLTIRNAGKNGVYSFLLENKASEEIITSEIATTLNSILFILPDKRILDYYWNHGEKVSVLPNEEVSWEFDVKELLQTFSQTPNSEYKFIWKVTDLNRLRSNNSELQKNATYFSDTMKIVF